ncbi:MAG: VLRF1 family aeRF1-type release factor [Trueperaceae bacterium]|nr:VLRF1 family aeRF1-type release factor [Trueperaceae bacterium]
MRDADTHDADALPVRRELEDLIHELQAAQRPLLSLYLDVHAGSDPNAPAQRADAALRELPLDRAVRERLERHVLSLVRQTGEGTLVAFAAEDPDDLAVHRLLRVPPPLPGGARDAVAHWGDPWLTPLELLLANEPPVIAAFVDERRARLFVQDLGEATEASSYVRALDTEAWRRFAEHSTGTPGQPARGGSGMDAYEAREDAWTARFVRDLAGQVAGAVAAREGARLVLLGESRRIAQLEEELPTHLRDAVLTRAPAPADPDLQASQWRDPLTEVVRSALHEEDEAYLNRLARDGLTGTGVVLDALQRGTLELVVVPADHDVEVVRCLGSGWMAEDEAAVRQVCPSDPIERVPLKERLLAAVRTGRARLRILRGPDAKRLQDRIGPIAGLPRGG